MLYMKSVNVRELQHNLGNFLDQVAAGETIEVRRRQRIVARIVPYTEDQPLEPWPDLSERLKQLYPEGPVSVSASDILYGDRGSQ
jgi:antitoxin (DNA-binding transcriptional repressor) of toxin-antitoxin stability system